MPLGTEIRLGPGDIVLDGEPSPPLKKEEAQQPPVFGPCINNNDDNNNNNVTCIAQIRQGRRIVAKRLDGSRCH